MINSLGQIRGVNKPLLRFFSFVISTAASATFIVCVDGDINLHLLGTFLFHYVVK